MAFGLPNSQDLNGLADKLGTIVASLGPEEKDVVTAAIGQLSDHATALETKVAGDITAILVPIEAQLARANTSVEVLADLVKRIVDNGLVVTVPLQQPQIPQR